MASPAKKLKCTGQCLDEWTAKFGGLLVRSKVDEWTGQRAGFSTTTTRFGGFFQ